MKEFRKAAFSDPANSKTVIRSFHLMNRVLEAAERYASRGFAVLPIPRAAKAPVRTNWQKLRLTVPELPSEFGPGPSNIGLLNGEPSGGLIDVDIDDDIALRMANEFLPASRMVSGRVSRPRSHLWYRVRPSARTTQLRGPDGETLVEVRSTGTQTIVPPSVHPSGEQVVWYSDGEPTEVDAEDLMTAVRHLAAATLIAKHWPTIGGRHSYAMAVAGYLLRGNAG